MIRNKQQPYFQRNALSFSRMRSGNKPFKGGLSFLPAIQIGSCFDALATNPSFIYKGMMFNESEGIWEALNTEYFELCKNMYASLLENEFYLEMLEENYSFQEEGSGTYEVNGMTIKTKCKLDIYVPNICIIDLKTTKATTEEEFLDSMIKSQYDRQGVWYLEHYPNCYMFVCIGVSKTPPHDIFIYKFYRDSDVYLKVKEKIDKRIKKLPNLEMYAV